ncbi:MAG: SMC-Scp complex subunit ScpB [Patescibacteria group bacterium]
MSVNLKSKIESLLFVSAKELNAKEIAKWTGEKMVEVEQVLSEMLNLESEKSRGIILLENNGKYKLATNPDNSEIVQELIRDERTSELTPASLETLTVIAYRGPITQFELEQIRGVSCTMILRNLLIKGLIEKNGKDQGGEAYYQISFDFLEYLGVQSVKDLPNYNDLHHDKNLVEFLASRQTE